MPAQSLEETIYDLVAGLAADLVPIVRQAALAAASEALGRERVRKAAPRIVEIPPAASPVRRTPRRAKTAAADAMPYSSAATIDDAIVTHLKAHPGLGAHEIIKALRADPGQVKRALVGLRAEGVLETRGKARGMLYRVAGTGTAGPASAQPGGKRRGGRAAVELVPSSPPAINAKLPRAVVELLAAQSDMSLEELVAALGDEPRLVKRAVTTLVVEGRVVAMGAGAGMRYRLAGSRTREKSRTLLDGAKLGDAILAHLAANPGLRAEDLTKALFASSDGMKRALVVLRADGRVQATGKARGTRYFLVGADRADLDVSERSVSDVESEEAQPLTPNESPLLVDR